MKQKTEELKGEIDNSTITVGDFKTFPSVIDRTITRKSARIQYSTTEKNPTNEENPISIYRTLDSTITENTFFSNVGLQFQQKNLKELKECICLPQWNQIANQ